MTMKLRQRRSNNDHNNEGIDHQNEPYSYNLHGGGLVVVGDLPTPSSSASNIIPPQSLSLSSSSSLSVSFCDSDNIEMNYYKPGKHHNHNEYQENKCSNTISFKREKETKQKEILNRRGGRRYNKLSKYNPIRRHNLHVHISLLSFSLLLFNHGQSLLLDGNHFAHDENGELQEQRQNYPHQHITEHDTFQSQNNSSKSSASLKKRCPTNGSGCESYFIHIPYLIHKNQGIGFVKPIEHLGDYDEEYHEDDYYYNDGNYVDDEEDEEDEEEDEEDEEDEDERCEEWAQDGECDENSEYMWDQCRQSCTKLYYESRDKGNHLEERQEKREPLLYDGKQHFFLEAESKHELLLKNAEKISQMQGEEEEYVRYHPEMVDDDYLPYNDDTLRAYFAFDDDNARHHQCRRTLWHRHHKPDCNFFHEIGLDSDTIDNSASYLASGGYRDAFRVMDYSINRTKNDRDSHGNADDFVLKLGSLTRKYDVDLIEMIRMDAMVMEMLSASDRIVDLYGHCGTSVSVAFLEPKDHFPLSTLIETPNALTPSGKLQIALSMAESIADLHGYEGGPIVHGDVQYVQWLLDKNDNIILSDFNRAEVMLWDEDSQEYCTYFSGGANGNVRSPEEYREDPVNEMIDVYSFGIVIYTILTQLDPYWDEGIDDVKGQILEGIKPFVDTDIRSNSEIEGALASVMDQCLDFDAEKRIDIFTVVSLLKDIVEEHGQVDSLTSVEWESMKFNSSLEEEDEDVDYENNIPEFGDDFSNDDDEQSNDEHNNNSRKTEANRLGDELR